MVTPTRTNGHPRNLFPDQRRFIMEKQPHIYQEFVCLLRKHPLLVGNRPFHEAVCHLLGGELQEIIDGYHSEEAYLLDDYRRAALYMRNVTTLCFEPGSINAHLEALERQVAQPGLSHAARIAYRIALCFYEGLLTFCYLAIWDALHPPVRSRQTMIPGPPSWMQAAPPPPAGGPPPASPPAPRRNTGNLRLVASR